MKNVNTQDIPMEAVPAVEVKEEPKKEVKPKKKAPAKKKTTKKRNIVTKADLEKQVEALKEEVERLEKKAEHYFQESVHYRKELSEVQMKYHQATSVTVDSVRSALRAMVMMVE